MFTNRSDIISIIISIIISAIYRDIVIFCLSLDGGFEVEGDGGDGAVTFDCRACTLSGALLSLVWVGI